MFKEKKLKHLFLSVFLKMCVCMCVSIIDIYLQLSVSILVERALNCEITYTYHRSQHFNFYKTLRNLGLPRWRSG